MPHITNSETLRFVPSSPGFRRRTQLVNALLENWRIVAGTGSCLEAHLVARLALTASRLHLCGIGTTAQEVWDLAQQQAQIDSKLLVVLTDSIGADQGRQLMRRLRRSYSKVQILLLVQSDHWLSPEALAECRAQAIVHVRSFGSGALIRALQDMRHGRTYVDPRILDVANQRRTIALSGRERQVLMGLSRGLANRAIAEEMGIATTTVRDYVSSLMRKLNVGNRTEVVAQAMTLGLVRH